MVAMCSGQSFEAYGAMGLTLLALAAGVWLIMHAGTHRLGKTFGTIIMLLATLSVVGILYRSVATCGKQAGDTCDRCNHGQQGGHGMGGGMPSMPNMDPGWKHPPLPPDWQHPEGTGEEKPKTGE